MALRAVAARREHGQDRVDAAVREAGLAGRATREQAVLDGSNSSSWASSMSASGRKSPI